MVTLNPFTRLLRSGQMLSAVLAGSVLVMSGCSSDGTEETTPQNESVTLSGVVYDSELSGASVELMLGNTVAATAITDSNGGYTLDVTVQESDKGKAAVISAARGGFKLRSLLGTMDKVVQNKDANGEVNGEAFAAANVTNVSTSVAAILEQEHGNGLPSTQAEIDDLIKTIQSTPALQTKIKQIAAAVKAVIDHGATNSAVDTDTLAKNLAASTSLAADLDAVISTNTSGLNESSLIAEVEGDPRLAVQLPATIAASDLIGKYYSVGKDTLVHFKDASAITIADYVDIVEGNTPTGSWSFDETAGTMTINVPNTTTNSTTSIVASNISGTANAVQMNVSVDGVAQGGQLMRRLEPIGVTGGNITTTMIQGKIFVDFAASKALRVSDTCDGTDSTTGWIANNVGKLTVSCKTHLGMTHISWAAQGTVPAGNMVLGLLSDGWNGTSMNQAVTTVKWEPPAPDADPVTSYNRVFQPFDAGVPKQYDKAGTGVVGSLRILPAENAAQMMFITANDTGGDTAADGKMDIYKSDGTASEKNHVLQSTHADTGALVVNGSTKQADYTTQHGSVSVAMNLGKHAGGKLAALYKPYTKDGSGNITALGSITSRLQYKLYPIVAADVSGKTFIFRNMMDTSNKATIVFNADGTGTMTDASGSDGFTWTTGPSVSGTTSGADYTSGSTAGATLVVTVNSDGTKIYAFADKSAGAGNLVIGSYELDASGNYTGMGAFVAIEQ